MLRECPGGGCPPGCPEAVSLTSNHGWKMNQYRNLLRSSAVAVVLLCQMGKAEAKAYKGAEVYTTQTALFGRLEMRMRMIRGSSLLSTFFAYKNGSEQTGALWEEIDIEALGKDDAKTWQSNIHTGNPQTTSEQLHSSPSSLAD